MQPIQTRYTHNRFVYLLLYLMTSYDIDELGHHDSDIRLFSLRHETITCCSHYKGHPIDIDKWKHSLHYSCL